MRIAVVSPLWRAGTTTVSTLLGLMISQTQSKSVCLTETGDMESRMMKILGVAEVEDITRSISQVIKLLETGTISKSELADYSRKINSNLDLFVVTNSKTSEDDSERLLKFVLDNLDYDITITDIRTPPLDPISQHVLDGADMIIMVLEPDDHMMDEYNKMKTFDGFGEWESKMVTIVNRYSPYSMKVKDICTKIGAKSNRVNTLSSNPFLQKVTVKNDFSSIIPTILNSDVRTIDLTTDLAEILKTVTSNLGIRYHNMGVTSKK